MSMLRPTPSATSTAKYDPKTTAPRYKPMTIADQPHNNPAIPVQSPLQRPDQADILIANYPRTEVVNP